MMYKKATGKLGFAYQTISNLEAKIEQITSKPKITPERWEEIEKEFLDYVSVNICKYRVEMGIRDIRKKLTSEGVL